MTLWLSSTMILSSSFSAIRQMKTSTIWSWPTAHSAIAQCAIMVENDIVGILNPKANSLTQTTFTCSTIASPAPQHPRPLLLHAIALFSPHFLVALTITGSPNLPRRHSRPRREFPLPHSVQITSRGSLWRNEC